MSKSIEPWIADLQNWDQRRRREAAAALGEADHTAAVEPLLAALVDAQADVRAEAARALGRLRDARAADPLTQALHDPYPQVRSQAAWALGQLGQPRVAAALVQGLPHQRSRVLQSFRQALAQLGPGAQEPLLAGLKGPDPGLRRAVAEALGKMEARWAVPGLTESLTDADVEVRQKAAEALGRIGDRRAVEELLARLQDPVPEVRQKAAEALGHIGDPRALAELRKLLHPWSQETPSRMKQAVEEALLRIEESKRDFSGRELMPAEQDDPTTSEDRSLALVDPTIPSTSEPTGREISPSDPREAKKRPKWWPLGSA